MAIRIHPHALNYSTGTICFINRKKHWIAVKRMLDVISIGAATEDVFVHVPKENFGSKGCVFLPGTKVEISGMEYSTGGGTTNSAVAFARLGLWAGAVCALGRDDAAKNILAQLRSEKVDCSRVAGFPATNTAYSVILTGFGRDRIVLFYRGSTGQLGKMKINWGKLRANWLYITSLHSSPRLLQKIARHARENRIKVAFNPGKKELELGAGGIGRIFGKIGVLLLNSGEAMKLTGSADVHRNLEKLSGLADVVAITQGRHGAHVTDGKSVYSMRPFDVPVADATGAGDAFGSAFSAAIMKGKKIDEALKWGTANASSVVMHLGTKNILLTQPQIKRFIEKYGRKENKVAVQKL